MEETVERHGSGTAAVETKKWAWRAEGYQFACWLHGVEDPQARLRGLEWLHLCIRAANEGKQDATATSPEDDKWAIEEARKRALANTKK